MRTSFSSICFYLLCLALFSFSVLSQTEQPTSESIHKKTAPSVVVVLTSKGDGLLTGLSTGVIVRSDGVILTAYHVIKDATHVQIRLHNGESFDRVSLLAFDERRDIAALKISGTDLPVIQMRSGEPAAGSRVLAISNPNGLKWSISGGLFSATRLADDIPNAGSGFRLYQFSAPVSDGSSGGLLVDENGSALGIIIGRIATTGSLNFAVPLASVNGLADTSQSVMTFGSSARLEIPQTVRPPSTIDVIRAEPAEILRHAKLITIQSGSVLISEKMMENGLLKRPEFKKWKMAVVQDRKLADLIIHVEHQIFTWDYRYTLYDQRTQIVLGSGKVTVWDGQIASRKFAAQIIKLLGEHKDKDEPPKPGK